MTTDFAQEFRRSGFSVAQFSGLTGIGESTVRRWLDQPTEANPRAEQRRLAALALNVASTDLFPATTDGLPVSAQAEWHQAADIPDQLWARLLNAGRHIDIMAGVALDIHSRSIEVGPTLAAKAQLGQLDSLRVVFAHPEAVRTQEERMLAAVEHGGLAADQGLTDGALVQRSAEAMALWKSALTGIETAELRTCADHELIYRRSWWRFDNEALTWEHPLMERGHRSPAELIERVDVDQRFDSYDRHFELVWQNADPAEAAE